MQLAKSGVPRIGALYSGNELGISFSASLMIVSHSACVFRVVILCSFSKAMRRDRCDKRSTFGNFEGTR